MNNNRLNFILNLIDQGIGVADIGTDHGYIPCRLAERGYKGNLFASDINRAPLETARSNANNCGIQDKIHFVLCNGISDQMLECVDTIIIAGMGGETICSILDHAEDFYNKKYRFIFQPMTKAEILRYWLVNNGFCIEEEYLVSDGKLYQVFTARFGGKTLLNDAELFTGSFKQLQFNPQYPEAVNEVKTKLQKTINGEEGRNNPPGSRYRFTMEILGELKEMEEALDHQK